MSIQFSVLIPVYNAEKYIEECLDSVLAQTYNNYELILVDDGSKDRSSSICDHYARQYPVVSVLHQENKGELMARRTALHHARGDYVVMVDADDALRKDALEKIATHIIKSGSDLVFFNASTDGKFSKPYIPSKICEQCFRYNRKDDVYRMLIRNSMLNTLWIKAIHIGLIDLDADYTRFGRIPSGADLLQFLPIVTNARKISYADECLYFYRENFSSVTHVYQPEKYGGLQIVYKEFERYLVTWGMRALLPTLYSRQVSAACHAARDVVRQSIDLDIEAKLVALYNIATAKSFRRVFAEHDNRTLPLKDRHLSRLLYSGNTKRILSYLNVERFFQKLLVG